jgi:hypothetical protein
MGKRRQSKSPAKKRRARKSLNEPEKLSPIPGAAPPEEPQVDEVLTPDEKSEARRLQREGNRAPL